MPLYEFACKKCGCIDEIFFTIKEMENLDGELECSHCKEKTLKMKITAPMVATFSISDQKSRKEKLVERSKEHFQKNIKEKFHEMNKKNYMP